MIISHIKGIGIAILYERNATFANKDVLSDYAFL